MNLPKSWYEFSLYAHLFKVSLNLVLCLCLIELDVTPVHMQLLIVETDTGAYIVCHIRFA